MDFAKEARKLCPLHEGRVVPSEKCYWCQHLEEALRVALKGGTPELTLMTLSSKLQPDMRGVPIPVVDLRGGKIER